MQDTLNQILIDFEQHLAEEGIAEGTRDGYLMDIRLFATWFEQTNDKELCPEQLTPIDIQSYRSFMQNVRRHKPTTINRKLASVRRLSDFWFSTGELSDSPGRKVKCVKDQRRHEAPRVLTKSEITRLLREPQLVQTEWVGKRDYALLQLLLQTGIRVGEAIALDITDIHINPRSGKLIIQKGKGAKYRELSLNLSVRKAITEYDLVRPHVANCTAEFLSTHKQRLSVRSVQDRLQEYMRRAGIQDATVHSLRHTYAKFFLHDNPGQIVELATILGHENLNSTRIYTRPDAETLRQRMEESSLNVFG